MKLQIVSDLHLEFSAIEIPKIRADILVLAGDICIANYFTRSNTSPRKQLANEWLRWFESIATKYSHVIYVLGNHEHYHGGFGNTSNILKLQLGHISNLRILDDSYIDINGYRFIGSTLWTDMNRDPISMLQVGASMNDYRLISNINRNLLPRDTITKHFSSKDYISTFSEAHSNVVVISHHAPSYASIHDKYKAGPFAFANPAYYSSLDGFILERPQIKLWIHGHTHTSFDYTIGDTRVICNPRGYQRETALPENLEFDPSFTVTI